MGVLVDTEDFKGKFKISQDCFSEQLLEQYIAKYEEIYLNQLLGAALYALFKADLSSQVPVTARFLDIFNPFQIDEDDLVHISEGMKEMMLGFLYFEYVKDAKYKVVGTGTVKQNKSISSEAGFNESGLFDRFNNAVCTYNEIQWFINDNDDDYPEENMQLMRYATPI